MIYIKKSTADSDHFEDTALLTVTKSKPQLQLTVKKLNVPISPIKDCWRLANVSDHSKAILHALKFP
jgi:hypothetical protein